MAKQPDLFWGLIASMWIGNVMLVIINLPLIGSGCALLQIPYRLLFPAIIVFCCIGVYTRQQQHLRRHAAGPVRLRRLRSSWHELRAARRSCSAFVLGPLMEENLRRAMQLSAGNPMTFVHQPDQRRAARRGRRPC